MMKEKVGMRFLLDKFRVISICLSLFIITLGFIIASDKEMRAVGVPLIFLAGMLMYVLGSLYEQRKNRAAWIAELLLAVCMLAAAAAAVLRLGGIL